MRALAASTVGLVLAAGCGRIGYDPLVSDDDGGVDAAFTATPCDTPVLVADLGPPATTPPPRYAVDVATTTTGMVAIYQLGDGQLHATGIAVDGGGGIDLIQTRGFVATTPTADFAAASLGDLVELAVDDPGSGGMLLYDLSAYGYGNGSTSTFPTKRGAGHGFITADPARGRFVIGGVNGTDTYRFTVDENGDLVDGPIMVITGGSLVPEGVGVVTHGIGYVAFAGTTSECTVAGFNEAWVPTGPPRTVSMTCHNLGLTSASSTNVVAGWNCDNDQVWTTGGNIVSAPLPAERSVFGDGSMVSSDPRVVTTPDGVWYAYAVAGGRLGRTLLDATSATASVAASDVYINPRVKAHDLVSRDGKAFLLWVESGPPADELYLMRLCTP